MVYFLHFYILEMFRKYAFFPFFFVILSVLAFWTHGHRSVDRLGSCRGQLFSLLHHLVVWERDYQKLHGHFTAHLDQEVSVCYEVKVSEASQSKLLIQAFARRGGLQEKDWASMDQDFMLRANFSLMHSLSERSPASGGLVVEVVP